MSGIEIEIETGAVCVSAKVNAIASEAGRRYLGRWLAATVVLAALAASEGWRRLAAEDSDLRWA